jgi:beta-glucosidase/6-phospho-beta-glucosidase/beta-galactosidase
MQNVMLATGIECSYPTIQHGKYRVDELETTCHYQRWREDLHLTRDMGIRYLRYGIPFHRVNPANDVYDWSFIDEVMNEMRQIGIEPIIDLCHFGMPDWLGNSFQNPEFCHAFTRYAATFAARYPWVKFYTPVNEIFVCAKFSALFGWWNEQEANDRAFVTAISHMARATLQAMEKILQIQPQAVFIQSESSEYTHSMCGDANINKRVEWENQVRFLGLDLIYAHQVRGDVFAWLTMNGMPLDQYTWFMNQYHYRCVIGTDYYVTNERMLDQDGSTRHVGEIFGWYLLTLDYYQRYHKPLMHTETNIREEDNSVAWLWKQWQNVLRMRAEGIAVLGFTWYSLIDQVDWDTALREPNHNINPLGLYTMERQIRPVGEAYKELIARFNWLPIVHNSDFLGIT